MTSYFFLVVFLVVFFEDFLAAFFAMALVTSFLARKCKDAKKASQRFFLDAQDFSGDARRAFFVLPRAPIAREHAPKRARHAHLNRVVRETW